MNSNERLLHGKVTVGFTLFGMEMFKLYSHQNACLTHAVLQTLFYTIQKTFSSVSCRLRSVCMYKNQGGDFIALIRIN